MVYRNASTPAGGRVLRPAGPPPTEEQVPVATDTGGRRPADPAPTAPTRGPAHLHAAGTHAVHRRDAR